MLSPHKYFYFSFSPASVAVGGEVATASTGAVGGDDATGTGVASEGDGVTPSPDIKRIIGAFDRGSRKACTYP